MNFPVEIVATCIGIFFAAILAERRAMWRKIAHIQKTQLILIIMLRDRGFKVPDKDDTDMFLKSNTLDL